MASAPALVRSFLCVPEYLLLLKPNAFLVIGQGGWADAGNVEQVFQALEGAVLGVIVDDGLGASGAEDCQQVGQFFDSVVVDINVENDRIWWLRGIQYKRGIHRSKATKDQFISFFLYNVLPVWVQACRFVWSLESRYAIRYGASSNFSYF